MKFRRIEYFVAAAEELNFTHAADRLHVSQPPFSKQIHELEAGLRPRQLWQRDYSNPATRLLSNSMLSCGMRTRR
jgi:DNA-binding transcriptional LysR family regulator